MKFDCFRLGIWGLVLFSFLFLFQVGNVFSMEIKFCLFIKDKKNLNFSHFSLGNRSRLIVFESLESTGVQKLAIQHACGQSGFQMACSQHLGLVTLFVPAAQAHFLKHFDMHIAIVNLVSGHRPDSLEWVCLYCCNACNIDITHHQCAETQAHPSPWQFRWPMANIKSFRLPNHLMCHPKNITPTALLLYGIRFLHLLYKPLWGSKAHSPGSK